MTNQHPSDMEIARLIDDKVDPDEREKILNHIDECDDCFEVYSEVLKFNEIEIVRKRKMLIPAAAVVLLCALLFPFLWQKFRQTAVDPLWTNAPGTEAVQHIEENISQIQDKSTYGFSPGLTTSYVRLGFFVEDLKRLANSPENQLKEKVLRLLVKEWEKVFGEQQKITGPDIKTIYDKSIIELDRKLGPGLEKESHEDLYFFGKTIERSIFLCMEGQPPDMKLMDRLDNISRENKLAKRIPELFGEIKNEKKLENILKHLKDIREIFL